MHRKGKGTMFKGICGARRSLRRVVEEESMQWP